MIVYIRGKVRRIFRELMKGIFDANMYCDLWHKGSKIE